MLKSNFFGAVAFTVTFLVICCLFYKDSINEFPSYIHAWTQADRYALALGFVNNNHNLFLPETFNLIPDPEYPPETETGITPVDFPIHEFNISFIMRVFKNYDPVVFRIYTLVYGLTGLYFLFLIILKQTKSVIAALASTLFVFSSPVYAYYANGFLPSITSLSSFIVGIYFLLKYYDNKSNKYFIIAIAFITLAALSRKPFIIPLIAIGLERLSLMIRSKRTDKPEIISLIASVFLFVAYNLYNYYLESKFGSLFLSNLNPSQNFNEFLKLSGQTWETWKLHYLNIIQYGIIVTGSLFIIFQIFKYGSTYFQQRIILIIFINYIGVVLYFIFMIKQFTHHDYYFIDSFFPLIIYFIILLNTFSIQINGFKALAIMILVLVMASTLISYKVYGERRQTGPWDVFEITKNNFKNSGTLFKDLNIPDNAKILILNANSSIPLTIMKRKSYALRMNNKNIIETALNWNYDYVIIQNYNFTDTYKNYPSIINKLQRIGGNEELSVYIKSNKKQTLQEFLGLKSEQLILSEQIDFDNAHSLEWNNVNLTDSISYDGSYSHKTSTDQEYSLEFSENKFRALNSFFVLWRGKIFISDNLDFPVNLVIDVSTDKGNIFYFSKEVNDQATIINKWQECTYIFPVDALNLENGILKVYLWNPSGKVFFVDDVELSIYSNNK